MSQRSGPRGLPARSDIDLCRDKPSELNDQLRLLADAARSGDLQAIDTLLYAIDSQRLAEPGIRRVLTEPEDIDEVSQDVLIVVAEQIGSFRGDSRLTSWLFGVGRNKALEFVRRKRDTVEFDVDSGDAHRISSLVATEVSVRDLLCQLPEHYRIAVTMRDLEGMTYADIAGKLDLNMNTVKAHISRGRALLASCAMAGL